MTLPTCYTPCLVSLSDKSADDRFYKERLPNLLLKRYLLYRYYVRTEVAHAAAHVKHHFRRCRRKGLHHASAYVVRGEELSHLEFLLGLGVFMVAGEIRLPEVVQSSGSRVAVVDAFLRNEVLAGVYGEKDFLVDLGTPVLRNLLRYDGIHVFSFFFFVNEDTPQGCLTGCLNKYFMNHSSLSVISSSRSLL